MRTLFIQDNFECHFVNLLSFTQQLFSSQLEINHVIQQQNKLWLNIMGEKHIWAPNCVETVLLHQIGLFLSPKFAISTLARSVAFLIGKACVSMSPRKQNILEFLLRAFGAFENKTFDRYCSSKSSMQFNFEQLSLCCV